MDTTTFFRCACLLLVPLTLHRLVACIRLLCAVGLYCGSPECDECCQVVITYGDLLPVSCVQLVNLSEGF